LTELNRATLQSDMDMTITLTQSKEEIHCIWANT